MGIEKPMCALTCRDVLNSNVTNRQALLQSTATTFVHSLHDGWFK